MLIDSFGRHITYLRISVTQRCNFRCLYCMPKIPFDYVPKEDLLSFEEMFVFVKGLIDRGAKKVHISGGKPLLHKDLSTFVKMIRSYKHDIDLTLTSNGFLLKDYAKELKNAELDRIDVPLDALDSKKAKRLAREDVLSSALAGIEEAAEVGLNVKLNTVALKGLNDDELIPLLGFAKNKKIQIRFIEFVENIHAYGALKGLKKDEIINILSQKYQISLIKKVEFAPVSLHSTGGYEFGIIDPHSDASCASCNCIKLGAERLLIPRSYHEDVLSVKEAVHSKDIEKALQVLIEVLENKPEKNEWKLNDNQISKRTFYQTGG